jgi:hypothetical protein
LDANAKNFTTIRQGRLFSDGGPEVSTQAHSRHLNTAHYEKRNMTLAVMSEAKSNQNFGRTLAMDAIRGRNGVLSQDGNRQTSKAGSYAITMEHNQSTGPRSVKGGGVTLKPMRSTVVQVEEQSNFFPISRRNSQVDDGSVGFQGFDEEDLIERYKMQNYVYSTEPLMLKRLQKETHMNKFTRAYNLEQLAERMLTADTLDKKKKETEQERMVRSGFTTQNKFK